MQHELTDTEVNHKKGYKILVVSSDTQSLKRWHLCWGLKDGKSQIFECDEVGDEEEDGEGATINMELKDYAEDYKSTDRVQIARTIRSH